MDRFPKSFEGPMKLFFAAASPFVRKCLVSAHELRLRWSDWITGQLEKITCGLAEFERSAAGWGERVDAGTIAVGCALGYLDFRFASLGWRENYPDTARWFEWFARRESMEATRPPAA
jgi:glutathione S-transferase